MKTFITFIIIVFAQNFYSQSFDKKTYEKLLKSDKIEFVEYAKSVGLTIETDSISESIFAKRKGCLYLKPTGTKNDNEYYELALIVSTLNKENNKLILENAKENPETKGVWTDNEYLYREWDMENPISKEMWYKVLIYKRK
ncbi:hypothetical protein HNP37_000086 [Flavobacterium nitrogenifigens]|uniref:Uncharacterized protein n=2 Tax=Flavobacterium TaxID=237 RepID=A0A7W7IT38_9FLAO|nr:MULTISPECIES: hypothetical protein [Flavobacterium]MBB4800047.1 hypothetical protein [Flavobacterium nitrogenifigens]MBB6386203.1 hypothetical protein [Flavobacterium notoginsengisoli]